METEMDDEDAGLAVQNSSFINILLIYQCFHFSEGEERCCLKCTVHYICMLTYV